MSDDATSTPATDEMSGGPRAWRLRGEIDGELRRYDVSWGENAIGSSRSGAVTIAASGISRRHALLVIASPDLLLSDLDSKNGTFVNGRRITSRTVIVPGDEIGLGPVSLRLETVDPDDAELAMRLEPMPADAPSLTMTGASQATPLLRRRDETISGLLLSAAEQLAAKLLARPRPQLEPAVSGLVRALGATGGCVLEWPSAGRPIVLAASGEVAELPPRPELHLAAGGVEVQRFTIDDGPPPSALGTLRQRGRPASGLIVWGAFPSRETCAPLLGLALRLVAEHRARSSGEMAPSAGGGVSRQPKGLRFPPQIVVGESPAMQALYGEMEALLQGDLSVLVLGETGVGKEHLARTLHDSSGRRHAPFVPINCAAIPAEMLEAELFGIGRGVATGVQARRGRFVQADGGTLLLDEIGDMPASLQAKLLRTLQDQTVWPLGSPPFEVDVRVIAATNTDLRARMEKGRFRPDLYYRLAGFVLRVPRLSERPQDIPPLVASFLRRFAAETGKGVTGLTLKALRQLQAYAWPGNVRELEHVVRRAVYLCPPGQAIDSTLLSAEILQADADAPAEVPIAADDLRLAPRLEAVERALIRRALTKSGGNQRATARLLDISRNGLSKRLKRLGIDVADFMP